jgi:hypothetical protein
LEAARELATIHLTTWRCNENVFQYGRARICAKVSYRRQSFREHLLQIHNIGIEPVETQEKVENCRVGRNVQTRFWRGFCRQLVGLKGKGVAFWSERFDHIGHHFIKGEE